MVQVVKQRTPRQNAKKDTQINIRLTAIEKETWRLWRTMIGAVRVILFGDSLKESGNVCGRKRVRQTLMP
jgi:hypothetical protein